MASRNETQLDWLSAVAQELAFQITVVRGCIGRVQQAGVLNEQQQESAEQAMHSLARMERLAVSLLDESQRGDSTDLFLTLPQAITEGEDMIVEPHNRGGSDAAEGQDLYCAEANSEEPDVVDDSQQEERVRLRIDLSDSHET